MKSVKYVNTNMYTGRQRDQYKDGTEVLWLCLSSWFPGGNTSVDNNPKHDGDDGTSILGPEGETFLYPLKGNVKGFYAVFKIETN